MDPETGALLNVNEHQTVTLRNPATGAQALVLYDADLTATPASLSQIVALDSSGRSEITLVETTLPLAFGIAGGVALVAGVFLAPRRKRRDAWPADDRHPARPAPLSPGHRPLVLDPCRRARRVSAAAGGRRARGGWTRRPPTPACVTQATRFDSHTSPITRAIAMSSADGSPSCMALVNMRTICRATVFTSAAALGSANMNARVIASVSIGSRCMLRVTRDSTYSMRSAGVSPGIGLRSSLSCICSNLLGQRADQQVDLGREVPVQRAERHVGALGDGPHLHGVVAALGRERQRGVQDPLAPFPLGGRADVGIGCGGRLATGTRSRRWHSGPLIISHTHDQRTKGAAGRCAARAGRAKM